MEKTTTTTTTTCGDDDDHLPLPLPEDCFYKILVGLPVTSLLRFKCVCKSWRDLIQSTFFIDLHTTFNLQTKEPSYAKYEDDIKLYMLSSGDGDGDGDGDGEDDYEDDDDQKKKMVLKVDDLRLLPFYKDFLLRDALGMVGSCNGIICLHDPEVMDDHRGSSRQHYSNLRDVSLWNPATRQFRILPKSIPIEDNLGECCAVLESVKWAKDLLLQNVVLEGDCKRVVELLNKEGDKLHWKNRMIMYGVMSLSSNICNHKFVWVPMSANCVADGLAKFARLNFTGPVCIDGPPPSYIRETIIAELSA